MVRQVVRKAMKLIARKKRRRQLDRILKIRPVLRPFRELCRRCREAELRWRKDPANILLREEAQQWRATVWHYFERQEENYQPELACVLWRFKIDNIISRKTNPRRSAAPRPR